MSELLPPTPPLLLHKPAQRKLKPDPIQAAPAKAGLSFLSLSLSLRLFAFYSPPPFSVFRLSLCSQQESKRPVSSSSSSSSPDGAGRGALGIRRRGGQGRGSPTAGPHPRLAPTRDGSAGTRAEGQTPRRASCAAPPRTRGSPAASRCPPYFYSGRQRVSLPPSPAQRRDTPRSDSRPLRPSPHPPPRQLPPLRRPLSPQPGGDPLSPAGVCRGRTATHSPGHACHALGCTALPLRCPARRWRLSLAEGDGCRQAFRTGSPKCAAKLKRVSWCSSSPKCPAAQSTLALQCCENTGLARKSCQILCLSLQSPLPRYRACPATNGALHYA